MATIKNMGKGSWKVQFSAGSEDGQRKRITKTFKVDPARTENAQRHEIEKLANTYETDLQRKLYTSSSRITIKQLSIEWLSSYVKRKKLAPNTQAHYIHLLEGRILPRMGGLYVQDVTPKKVDSFITWLENDNPKSARARGEKLSGTTCKKYHTLLHSLFEFAIKQGYVTINPVASTTAPQKDTPEKTAFDKTQAAQLITVLDSEPLKWRAFFNLALHTQMRRGELIALTWDDINLKDNFVFVNKSAYYVKNQGVLTKLPKTAAGRRRISIPEHICTLLGEYKKEQTLQRLKLGSDWQDNGAVFTQWNGQRLHLDSPTKHLKTILEKSGLPIISLHGLRHTGASLLIASGEDYKTVQHRLGHSRASTTLDTYAHPFDYKDVEASSALDTILTEAQNRAK